MPAVNIGMPKPAPETLAPRRKSRQIHVELTESGSARLWRLYGPLVEEGAKLLERFTRAELESMLDLLEKMQALVVEHRKALADAAPRTAFS